VNFSSRYLHKKRFDVEDKMEEKLESIEAGTESAKQELEGAGTESESIKQESGPESAEARPDSESAGTKSEITDDKEIRKESKFSKKKIAGYIQLASALILIILSVRLFWNTRGTRLLYVSVAIGRISRYYWIFLAVGFILLLTGMITLRRSPKKRSEA